MLIVEKNLQDCKFTSSAGIYLRDSSTQLEHNYSHITGTNGLTPQNVAHIQYMSEHTNMRKNKKKMGLSHEASSTL